MLPESITSYLADHSGIDVQSAQNVSGGSINQAVKITSGKGNFFLKWNSSAPEDFFTKEAEGLSLLRSANSALRVPEVIVTGKQVNNRTGFLLMEYIEEGRIGDSFAFGAELAKLHQTTAPKFGLETDNYIGSLPQSNRMHNDWQDFFSKERIKPQLKMAIDSGKMDRSLLAHWDRLASRLDELLPPTKPSLIHGDLWGGNYLFDSTGKATLIDPAVYYGHSEMDLAFSKMFGGFSGDFYEGYESVAPLEPGFSERVPIYNLYPLLVHVNLFGGHYTSQAAQLLKKY
jgi:protein-ribulosamine 3-kinase